MSLYPGIIGSTNLDGEPIDLEDFRRMKTQLTGNGNSQNEKGDWYAVAQHGYNSTGREGKCLNQDEGKLVITEGRIDNIHEITKELNLKEGSGYGKTISEGINQKGFNVFQSISGALSTAILDTRKRSLVLIRDPIALRPLFYSRKGNTVKFGGDVRQILAGQKEPPRIAQEKLLELFSPMYLIDEGWSDADSTMFEGIRSVPYGSDVFFSRDKGVSTHRYWSPPTRLNKKQSPHDSAMHFRELFLKVLEEQLDTPYGVAAELSGGIDSGCNVSIAAHMLTERKDNKIKAYTAVFGSQSSNERKRVRSIYERYPNVEGRMVRCDDRIHFLEGGEFDAYRTTAQPSRQNLPETFVELTKRANEDGAKILLSGEGADWFLEGSDMLWDSLIKQGKFGELMRNFNVLRRRSSTRKALGYILKSAFPAFLPGASGRRAYLQAHYESTVNNHIPDIFGEAFHVQLCELLRYQRDQLLLRKNLSCWGQTLEHELMFPPNHVWQGVPTEVEMRFPYLDRRIVEFGLQVPPEHKFRIDDKNTSHYGCRKFLQRTAFGDLVPSEVIESQQKETYGSPVNKRLTLGLPDLLTGRFILSEIGVVDHRKLCTVIKEFLADQGNDAHQMVPWLDTVLATEKWLRATVEEFPDCRLPTFRL